MESNPILAALDVPTPEKAITLAEEIYPHVGGFKIGLELFTAGGSKTVKTIQALGKDLADARDRLVSFLDGLIEILPLNPADDFGNGAGAKQ